jgi:hypothetical protein
MTVTKKELALQMAVRAGIRKQEAYRAVESIFGAMRESLIEGNRIGESPEAEEGTEKGNRRRAGGAVAAWEPGGKYEQALKKVADPEERDRL